MYIVANSDGDVRSRVAYAKDLGRHIVGEVEGLPWIVQARYDRLILRNIRRALGDKEPKGVMSIVGRDVTDKSHHLGCAEWSSISKHL